MKLFKKNKSGKQKSKGARVMWGAQSKYNKKPKNNRQRHGVQEYHMWEVHEVTGGVRAVNKGVC